MIDFIIYRGKDFSTLVAKSSRAQHWVNKPEEGVTAIANEQVEDAVSFLSSNKFVVLTEDEEQAKLN